MIKENKSGMSAPLCTVTPLEVHCEACNDTGSRYNSNFLDCTRCTAAIERSTFQSQIYSGEKISLDDKLWRAYQLGKAAGEASTVEGVLTEMQPGGSLHQPATPFDEARILEIARKMPMKPWGIGSRAQDAIEFAWEILKSAAPVVPVAAQPVVPDAINNAFVTLVYDSGSYSISLKFNKNSDVWAVHDFLLRSGGKEYNAAAPQPAASVTDVAKDAARLDFLENCVMNHRCISAERDRDSMVGSPTYGDLPTVTIFTIPSQHKKGVGLRGAIDAAIAAQQGEKTK